MDASKGTSLFDLQGRRLYMLSIDGKFNEVSQGLHKLVQERDKEVEELKAKVARLSDALRATEKVLLDTAADYRAAVTLAKSSNSTVLYSYEPYLGGVYKVKAEVYDAAAAKVRAIIDRVLVLGTTVPATGRICSTCIRWAKWPRPFAEGEPVCGWCEFIPPHKLGGRVGTRENHTCSLWCDHGCT